MNDQYIQRLKKIEDELEKWLPAGPESAWTDRIFPGLPGGVDPALARSLLEPGRDLLKRGGKRWRPLLMTLVCESLGGGDGAVPLVPLVEFCHTASLVHDDIEDNSGERRGKPAVHLLYGIDRGINSGSFLYFLPLACIDEWVEKTDAGENSSVSGRAGRVFAVWGEYMRKLHLGQAMDIHWHQDFSSLPGIDEYYTMCALKTGCLARLAAVLGVYAVPFPADAARKTAADILGGAAEKLGVGFQILDDVKNLTAGIPGKERGDDIAEGKKSLPVLLYLHRRPDRLKFAAECFAAARKDGPGIPLAGAFIDELDAAGVLEEAEEKGLSLIKESAEVFSAETVAGELLREPGRTLLGGLAGLIS
ncbi:MAG: polyprenyl synthetase family protein [Treponema sp.]|jgi:octaprenyl-diphosphate synthase|nr:polyprenyl synthetase family protein [Treponema sp.]